VKEKAAGYCSTGKALKAQVMSNSEFATNEVINILTNDSIFP
jgi:hypothetical protein